MVPLTGRDDMVSQGGSMTTLGWDEDIERGGGGGGL